MAAMLPPDINGRLSPDGDGDTDGEGVKPAGGHPDGDHHHHHHHRHHHNHHNQLAPPDGHATPPPTPTPTPAEVAATETTPARQSEQEPSPLPSPLTSPLPTPGVGGINHSRSHRIRSFGPHERDTTGPSRGATRIRTYAAAAEGESEDRTSRFPRISRPVELMRSSYDCVVIGSGYGGAVAASRVARSEGVADGRRRTVCVLERGREKWPGEYPSKTVESLAELHVTGDFAPGSLPGHLVDEGDPTGMYHLIFGKGLNAVVGNGLGGTSLMNANVFLEADKGTLGLPQWPAEIRDDPACLDKYYQKARDVLEPVEYPDDWPELPKVSLLRRQAEALGMAESFRMVPQTTRFRNGPNSCGVEMLASASTGQDTTGVNDGSKTTTLVTYLADAWNWGAEMFCECEVRHVERAADRPDGGYIVYFAWHGRGRGRFRANMEQDLMWVHARECVFLGAGAIGTTEILLRSRDTGGLPLSSRVGTGMSGNGDMLAFGYNTQFEANAIGRPQPDPYRPVGPTINAVIDRREAENPLDGFVIEEGAIPSALKPFLQALLEHMPGREPPPGESASYAAAARARLARWTSRLLGPYFRGGALDNTQVYLVMSHDSSQAALTLQDDKPVLEFLGVGRSDHVHRLNDLLAKATHAVGGTFVRNPFEALMGKQQVTVHPIGGACMASDGTGDTGATNHVGELFTGVGAETHAGLVVADASVIPAALGVNPLATITALAERSVEHWCRSRGLRIHTRANGLLDLFGEPQHAPLSLSDEDDIIEDNDDEDDDELDVVVGGDQNDLAKGDAAKDYRLGVRAVEAAEAVGIRGVAAQLASARAVRAAGFGFTEVMTGHLHYNNDRHRPRPHNDHPASGEAWPAGYDETPDAYRRATRTAQRLCETARFFLSTEALSTAQLVRDVNHAALLTGTFACPAIPGSPFMVQRGEFDLFVDDCRAPGTKNLTYDFDLRGVDGRLLHFHGYKVVDSSVALAPVQFWRATSTLYVTVTEPGPAPASRRGGGGERRDPHAWRGESVVARGIMQIRPSDFLSQVLTMSPTGAGLLARAVSAASFLTYFTRRSVSLLLTPFTPLQYPTVSYRGYINETPPTSSFKIVAADGVKTRMHMWEPTHVPSGAGGGVRNLFLVPGASVDHQIFALPTIPYNAVNYFTRAGYRVFVAVHRIGQLQVARNGWTTYDARKDVRACLEMIRGRDYAADNGPDNRVYVVSHCMGSVVFSVGLLDGTVPASWIRGISASQVLMNPVWTTMNTAKVLMGPVPADRLYEAAGGSWFSCGTSAEDGLLQRVINQALRLYPETRREMCSSASCHRCSLIFGRLWNHANLNEATHRQIDRFFGGVTMRGLRLLMRQGFEGHVMNNDFERLTTAKNVQRLRGLPVMLFVGADNAVLSTEATARTYETLCDTFGISDGAGGLRYRRREVPGYGHLDCWMGRHAWRDVYPIVREEIDRVCRGEGYAFEEPDDRFSAMVEGGGMLY